MKEWKNTNFSRHNFRLCLVVYSRNSRSFRISHVTKSKNLFRTFFFNYFSNHMPIFEKFFFNYNWSIETKWGISRNKNYFPVSTLHTFLTVTFWNFSWSIKKKRGFHKLFFIFKVLMFIDHFIKDIFKLINSNFFFIKIDSI